MWTYYTTSKKVFIAIVIATVLVVVTVASLGMALHLGAFLLGCLFMFILSSIRYKGQSLIGGRDYGIDE